MRRRRAITVFLVGVCVLLLLGGALPRMIEESIPPRTLTTSEQSSTSGRLARDGLNSIVVKGRSPKDGYSRTQFGDGWGKTLGCSTRDIILNRDLKEVSFSSECTVTGGILDDPYTGTKITFSKENADKVQIDHVVALSDAWQKGAWQLTKARRIQFANDPLELLAVDGPANQQKSDGDAATWLPKNKAFRCEYVARQIAIKIKYALWVTSAEKYAMGTVLDTCPNQALPE